MKKVTSSILIIYNMYDKKEIVLLHFLGAGSPFLI
jgi:hypothetical protein